MVSKVRMTRFARNQLSQYIGYITIQLKNPQAAKAVAQDARDTKAALLNVADSLNLCSDPELRFFGYRIMHFQRHRYLFVYSIHGNTACIEAVYHELQDYENIFKGEILGM